MSKKTAGFEEFIIDDSMLMDTNTKGSNSKFLANDDAESIMLSVPRGSSEKSVAESIYKQPLFDTVSISDEEDLSSASSFQSESASQAFPEVSINESEVPLSKAAFPEMSISNADFPNEAPIQINMPDKFDDIKEEPLSCSNKLVMGSCPSENPDFSDIKEEPLSCSNKLVMGSCPSEKPDFSDIKEEPLSCSNKLVMGSCPSEKPDFDDVSVSTIQLEDYKPVSKMGGMLVNSTKILNFVPSPMEDLIENADASANKSINFFLKMEKMDDHISINSVSVSKENDKPAELKETSISFDGKTGNLSVNKNGVVSEKVIETDSFTDFISKIYEPLMGRNNSISDSSLDSGEITDEEEAGQ